MTASLTLLLNAAEQRIQFGFVDDDAELVCAQDWAAASQGVELLAPVLADALGRLGFPPAAIARVACVTGPGSFTGLRLALTTASAFGHALGVPLAGINYLELVAEGAPCAPGQAVRVLTRARRGLVYMQDFARDGAGVLHALHDPGVRGVEASLDDLPGTPTVLVGSGLALAPALYAAAPGVLLAPADDATPRWGAFARLAGRATYALRDLDPLYLRASEAEDNLEMLAARRGEDPAKAREVLCRLLTQRPHSVL